MKVEPKKLLESLCKNASTRKVESLRLLYAICLEQQQRGSSDYSIATIGRLSNERGGPSAAAIRNKPGEDYRALIKAYADSVDGHSKKRSKVTGDPIDDMLEGVNDPVLRARLGLVLAEIKSLRAQLLATRHLANQNAVLELVDTKQSKPDPQSNDGRLRLTLQEVTALEAAVNPSTLSHWGWTVDKSGRVLSESGQVVFRAGFTTAIEKSVKFAADF